MDSTRTGAPNVRGHRGGVVGAAVGDHDHIERTGGRARGELPEQPAYHPGFVMRGNHHTDHVGQYA